VELVRKATEEVKITIFLKSFGVKKINELVVTSNKLTNNFVGLVASGLGPDVDRKLLTAPLWVQKEKFRASC
jgi:hypothetical protein